MTKEHIIEEIYKTEGNVAMVYTACEKIPESFGSIPKDVLEDYDPSLKSRLDEFVEDTTIFDKIIFPKTTKENTLELMNIMEEYPKFLGWIGFKVFNINLEN